MRQLVLPAGASVRFTATARADRDLHRWDLELRPLDGGAARLTFASRIGGRDIHQRIDIPAQDVDCRLEIRSRHESIDGWVDDQATSEEDTPTRLAIGFCDPSCSGARPDDVLLSFAFEEFGGGRRVEDDRHERQERSGRDVPRPKHPKAQSSTAGRPFP